MCIYKMDNPQNREDTYNIANLCIGKTRNSRASSRLKGQQGRGVIESKARSTEDSKRTDPKAPFISKAREFHVLVI